MMLENTSHIMKDKHIIITGASSGLGKSLAIKASLAGAKVTLIARDKCRLLDTVNAMYDKDKHSIYSSDLSNLNEIESLLKNIASNNGKIDGFCHCAGITGSAAIRPIKVSNTNFVDSIFKIHVLAFIEAVRVLSLPKVTNSGANIVGISSVVAYRGEVGCSSYAAAKGAVDSFIKNAAVELYNRKIKINSVAFGTINSETYLNMVEEDFDKLHVMGNQKFGGIDLDNATDILISLLSNKSLQYTGNTIEFFAGR